MSKELSAGVRSAVPIVLGYIPIGLAFGILAIQQGLSVLAVFVMSLIVYAGSAQFIATGMLAAGASMGSIIATTFLVNLRHLLMSASLSPYFKKIHPLLQPLIAFGITDETFAVSTTAVRSNERGVPFFVGLHVISQSSWVLSTVIGAMMGNLIPNPERFGLDYALPAMFVGLLLMQMGTRRELLVALAAGLASVAILLFSHGNWNVILAAIIAASLGVVMEKWQAKSSWS